MKIRKYPNHKDVGKWVAANYNQLLIAFLGAFLFAPMLFELIKVWETNQDLSHGFFVIPMCLYMIWRKREILSEIPSRPTWLGLPILLAGTTIFVLASIIKFHTIYYYSSMLIVLGGMLLIYGSNKTKKIALPLIFLLFMFPIPTSYYILITNPLKYYITLFSANIIKMFGIPVYQEGNLLSFANTKLEVAEACSGVRSIYSYLMIGFMLSIFSKYKKTIAIMIISAIPLSLFINVIRVSGTGILANFYGEKVAQGFFHEFSGIVLFIVGLIILYAFYYFLENRKT